MQSNAILIKRKNDYLKEFSGGLQAVLQYPYIEL